MGPAGGVRKSGPWPSPVRASSNTRAISGFNFKARTDQEELDLSIYLLSTYINLIYYDVFSQLK